MFFGCIHVVLLIAFRQIDANAPHLLWTLCRVLEDQRDDHGMCLIRIDAADFF